MNKKFMYLSVIFLMTLLIANCSKEEEELPETELVFQSLVSEKDTIIPGETTTVTATATGSNLTYRWSATIGDILGSGSEVTYAASPCQAGTNQITCEITDGSNQSASKTIDIVVYE
jgi:hypothetical protein